MTAQLVSTTIPASRICRSVRNWPAKDRKERLKQFFLSKQENKGRSQLPSVRSCWSVPAPKMAELPWAGVQHCEPRSSHTDLPSGSCRVQEPFRGGRRIMSAAMQEQLDTRDKKGPCSTLYTFTKVNLEGTVGLSVHF